ncbi:MAG: toll/interleukin-1 receptor domain-containing protein [Limisphaerales bacterium]
MPDEFRHDVFLSHSAKDKAVVRPLAERLRKDGVKVWLDEWMLKPGDSIPAKIEEGLERSRVLVLCMSAHAFGSDWAQLEAGTFRFRDPLNKERRFLPLRRDTAPLKGAGAITTAPLLAKLVDMSEYVPMRSVGWNTRAALITADAAGQIDARTRFKPISSPHDNSTLRQ